MRTALCLAWCAWTLGTITLAAELSETEALAVLDRYLSAAQSAKSNTDLEKFWSKRRNADRLAKLKDAKATPDPEMRAMGVELLTNEYKLMQVVSLRAPKVLSIKKDGARTVLELEATAKDFMSSDPDKRSRVTGSAWLVREGGQWRIDDEKWNLTP